MITAAQRRTLAAGRRFAAYLRTVVILCLCAVAVIQTPSNWPITAGLAVWALRPRPIATDTALIAGLCLAQRWVVPAEALPDSTNWVLAVVSVTVVAQQWFTTTKQSAVITAVLVAATIAGNPQALPIALWTFVEAAMSRGVFLLLQAGAKAADRAAEQSQEKRREAAVSAARRADEREHLAVLHDTAAATLFAAGAGMVDGSEPWLAERAERDIAALSDHAPEEQDLVQMLEQLSSESPLTVAISADVQPTLPTTAVTAISRAVREALTNVAKHAGTNTVQIHVTEQNQVVRVDVIDRGRGFDPATTSPHRRGITQSIMDRMRRVGGRAEVVACEGGGTRVRVEWGG